jgi:hypothetical protein
MRAPSILLSVEIELRKKFMSIKIKKEKVKQKEQL